MHSFELVSQTQVADNASLTLTTSIDNIGGSSNLCLDLNSALLLSSTTSTTSSSSSASSSSSSSSSDSDNDVDNANIVKDDETQEELYESDNSNNTKNKNASDKYTITTNSSTKSVNDNITSDTNLKNNYQLRTSVTAATNRTVLAPAGLFSSFRRASRRNLDFNEISTSTTLPTKNDRANEKSLHSNGGNQSAGFFSNRLAMFGGDRHNDPIVQHRHRLETSLTSLLDFLQRKGVSKACIQELRKQVQHQTISAVFVQHSISNAATSSSKNHQNNNTNHDNRSKTNNSTTSPYVRILEQCQMYVECIITSNLSSTMQIVKRTNKVSSSSTSSSLFLPHMIDMETMHQMILNCWAQLCSLVAHQYRMAYKIYHGMRRKHIMERQMDVNSIKQQNLQQKLHGDASFQSSDSFESTAIYTETDDDDNDDDNIDDDNDSGMIVNCSHDHVGSEFNKVSCDRISPASTMNVRNHEKLETTTTRSPWKRRKGKQQQILERALSYQMQLAEECCSCQKALLLAQAQERRQRQLYQQQQMAIVQQKFK